MTFAVNLLHTLVCASHFEAGRTTNILYSAFFFVAGCLINLYLSRLARLNRLIALGIAGDAIALYFTVGGNAFMCLLASSALLIYAIIDRRYWEQGYKVLQFHQHGDIPVTYDGFPYY